MNHKHLINKFTLTVIEHCLVISLPYRIQRKQLSQTITNVLIRSDFEFGTRSVLKYFRGRWRANATTLGTNLTLPRAPATVGS